MYLKDKRSNYSLIWHQVSTRTWAGRYQKLFHQISSMIHPSRILSFGCSTGEECATLASVFPDAITHGTDINENVLNLAVEAFPEHQFYPSSYENISQNGPYDAIFAMNVFHRQTAGAEALPIYSSEYFEEQLAQLAKALSNEGVLVLHKPAFSIPPGYSIKYTINNECYIICIEESL